MQAEQQGLLSATKSLDSIIGPRIANIVIMPAGKLGKPLGDQRGIGEASYVESRGAVVVSGEAAVDLVDRDLQTAGHCCA